MNDARHSAGVLLIVEALRRRGTVRFRVHGASMRPLLRSGDVVEVRRETAQGLKPGDLAMFCRAGAVFVHRVIRSSQVNGQWTIATKGDAFSHWDDPLRSDEIVGRVTRIHRGQRVISLDTLPQRLLRKLALAASGNSRYWYEPARKLTRAARKFVR